MRLIVGIAGVLAAVPVVLFLMGAGILLWILTVACVGVSWVYDGCCELAEALLELDG